jgi:DNA-binding protein Fis
MSNKKPYIIELCGCDNSTIFEMDLTDSEKALLDRVAGLSVKRVHTVVCLG